MIQEIPFDEIVEARNGPFDKVWNAIRNQDVMAFRDRETAKQLMGAQSYLNQLIADYVPHRMDNPLNDKAYTFLIMTALNVLTGWRICIDDDDNEFNDCDNYDDPFVEWNDD